ncbi:MAG: hypothetical protein GPJ54_01530 [Candidatus Heimdallarchaeota archaeon]|nr:hypothetical protein [Candidatus Heimdallarchaeota archaeon]
MITRVIRVVFLFAIVGFSTVVFQNGQVQSSMTVLTDDHTLFGDSSFDIEMFTALVFLLVILGYAVFLMISIINRTHLWILETSTVSQSMDHLFSI